MIVPLFNNVLVELTDEFDGIIGSSGLDANVQKGVLRQFGLMVDHLTASAGYEIADMTAYEELLEKSVGKVVYWQEYADSGAKFDIAGNKYVLVPFYRLIGFDDETTKGSK